MALISCPECQTEVSDTLKVCVHCGYRLKPKKPFNRKIFIPIAAVLVVTVIAVAVFSVRGYLYDKKCDEAYLELREYYFLQTGDIAYGEDDYNNNREVREIFEGESYVPYGFSKLSFKNTIFKKKKKLSM